MYLETNNLCVQDGWYILAYLQLLDKTITLHMEEVFLKQGT